MTKPRKMTVVLHWSECRTFRIVQPQDDVSTPKDLMVSHDIFEAIKNEYGLYGFVLERLIDGKWHKLDARWGFEGPYSPGEEPYQDETMDEFKETIAVELGDLKAILKRTIKRLEGGSK